MDKIINYLLLTIIFVFDPLAIALVIAANFAFEQLRSKTKENIYGETVKVEEEEFDKDNEWDVTLEDGLDEIEDFEEVKEQPEEETPRSFKDPSQLSSYRRRKIEEEGKKYW